MFGFSSGPRNRAFGILNQLAQSPNGMLWVGDPTVDELDAVTKFEIYPEVVTDNFFLAVPELAYFRDHCMVPFGGGSFMQAVFRYAPMIGGFYAPGANFNITKRQTLAALQFDTRYMYVSIPEYKEQIQVENVGQNAVISILEADMQNGIDTANVIVAVNMALNGQGVRSLAINGWPEAINDGITPSYDGAVYTSYGNQARNGAVGSALNSVPVFCGTAAGAAGVVQYSTFEEGYQDASIGKKEPNLGVGNKAVIAYVKEKLVVQQRFQQERDPVWGVMGFRLNNAMILKSDYFPSLKYGQNDPVLGNYLTGTFVSPGTTANGGTANAQSNLPVSGTTVTVGEVFNFYNTFDWLFRVSDNEEFGFGFSGFVPTNNNTRIVGQIKAMVNMENLSPRTQKQFYGIGG
jgi:hypothetical protein